MTTPASDLPPVVPPTSVLDPSDPQALRALATSLVPEAETFDNTALRKGIVESVSYNDTYVLASVTLSGDTTVISNIQCFAHYSPQIGDVTILAKQGNGMIALGAVASSGGWQTASLNAGFTHNGNSNGTLQYRIISDHGTRMVQWRGGVDRTSGSTICSVSDAYAPSSRRSLVTARNAEGNNEIKVDFQSSGNVDLVGMTTGGLNTTYTALTDHTDHRHTVVTTDIEPVWISLTGLRYHL